MTGFPAKMSTYKQGFGGGLTVRDSTIAVNHPGKIFWVGDGDTAGNTPSYPNRKTPSDGNVGTFLAPFATGDKAVEQCVGNRGDIIYFLPGYVEDLAAETDLVLDVAGVTLVGLGTGDNQAQWTFSNAAGVVDVDHTLMNFLAVDRANAVRVDLELARIGGRAIRSTKRHGEMLGRLIGSHYYVSHERRERVTAFAERLADAVGPSRIVLRRTRARIEAMADRQYREHDQQQFRLQLADGPNIHCAHTLARSTE